MENLLLLGAERKSRYEEWVKDGEGKIQSLVEAEAEAVAVVEVDVDVWVESALKDMVGLNRIMGFIRGRRRNLIRLCYYFLIK